MKPLKEILVSYYEPSSISFKSLPNVHHISTDTQLNNLLLQGFLINELWKRHNMLILIRRSFVLSALQIIS